MISESAQFVALIVQMGTVLITVIGSILLLRTFLKEIHDLRNQVSLLTGAVHRLSVAVAVLQDRAGMRPNYVDWPSPPIQPDGP
jgi:hypothetical protein